MAVLPTPGSPISTGLFLLRRCSTWIARRISSSRPMTGSSLPARARSVRSIVYFFSDSRWPSASCELTLPPPRTAVIAASSALRVRPFSRARRPASDLSSVSANSTISLAMNWSPCFCASLSARFSSDNSSRPICTSPPLPLTLGSRCNAVFNAPVRPPMLAPARCSSERVPPSSWFSKAISRCAGSMYWLSLPTAWLCASARASCSLVVSLSSRIEMLRLVYGFEAQIGLDQCFSSASAPGSADAGGPLYRLRALVSLDPGQSRLHGQAPIFPTPVGLDAG
jgi:hypothetical protein